MHISPIEMSGLVATRSLDASLIEHTAGIRAELEEGKQMKDIGPNMRAVDLSLTRREIITEFAGALEDYNANVESVRSLKETLIGVMGSELSKVNTVEGIDANDQGLKASALKLIIRNLAVNVTRMIIERYYFTSVFPGKDLKHGDNVLSLTDLLDPTVIHSHTPEVINVKGVYQFNPNRGFILTQTNTRLPFTPNETFMRQESAQFAIDGARNLIVANGCLTQLAAMIAISYQRRLLL